MIKIKTLFKKYINILINILNIFIIYIFNTIKFLLIEKKIL